MGNKIIEVKKIIEKSNDFLILSHIDPDGDAIGSSLAIFNYLKIINKKVEMYSNKVPKNLSFIPCFDEIIIDRNRIKDNYDTVIVLDCGDVNRIEGNIDRINYNNMIVIDHHITHVDFGDINIVIPNAAATCEILFYLLFNNQIIDKNIAICLYTGIITDTGALRYNNVTPKTLDAVKYLIETKIDYAKIIHLAFDVMSLKKFDLLKLSLNNIEIIDNKIAYLFLNKEELDMFDEDNISEGIVNYGKNIEGIEVSILIKQVQLDEYKISLRSNEYVDVSKIAFELNGGGHLHAAGITIKGNVQIEEIKKQILQKIYEQL